MYSLLVESFSPLLGSARTVALLLYLAIAAVASAADAVEKAGTGIFENPGSLLIQGYDAAGLESVFTKAF